MLEIGHFMYFFENNFYIDFFEKQIYNNKYYLVYVYLLDINNLENVKHRIKLLYYYPKIIT